MNPGSTPEAQAEHDAKMAALADANQGNLSYKKDGETTQVTGGEEAAGGEAAPAVAERPADIPEKFWDAVKGEVNIPALLKSQKDAEAALRGKQAEPAKAEEAAAEETEAEAAPEVKADQTAAVTAASAEFAKDGALSESTYDQLATVGLDRGMVDTYISGQQAIVTQLETAAATPFGGMEGYNEAANWAAENLTSDDIAALDVQLTSSNPAIVKAGAEALKARHAAEADITPDVTLSGQGSPSNAGTAFRSGAEMQAAMSDPRYRTDPAFRAEVADKIARSQANLFS